MLSDTAAILSAVDVKTWAVKVLQGLGYQPTTGSVRALVGWQKAEGGHWENDASYNPLNTTLNAPGARSINGIGVKAYRNWQEGINATVKTLRNGNYGQILQGLKVGHPNMVANAIASSPWGTNGDLVHRTIGATHVGQLPNVVSGPSAGAGGLPGEMAAPGLADALQPPQPKQITPVSIAPPPTVVAPVMPKAYRPLDPGSAPAPPPQSDLSLSPVATAAGVGGAGGGGGGGQVAPPTGKSDQRLESILQDANKIDAARVPYLWGGGHGAKQIRGSKVTPMDCSGAVSRVLGLNPRVSGQFEGWGKAGRGKHVTIYANGEHVLLEINGHFWGTSNSNPGGGAGWIASGYINKQYLSRFVARHPPGL